MVAAVSGGFACGDNYAGFALAARQSPCDGEEAEEEWSAAAPRKQDAVVRTAFGQLGKNADDSSANSDTGGSQMEM